MKLSTEDRLEILDLYSRYSWAFDERRAGEWASLFAEDGSFVIVGGPRVDGRAGLEAFADKMSNRYPGIRHLASSIMVEAEGDGARGRAYVVAVVPDGDGGFRNLEQGSYEDRFVSLPEGWRFQTRTFTAWLGG